MKFLVLLSGIFISGVCVTFFMYPSLVEELIKWVGKKRNLITIVLIRLVNGGILMMGAETTRLPTLIWWLGVLFIAAAILLLVFPADTIKRMTGVWLDRSPLVIRAWVTLPLAIGVLVIYSVL
jgi:hypothetical protein